MKTVEIKLVSGNKVSVNVKKRIKYSDLSVIATAIRNDVFANDGYYPYMKNLGLVHYMMLYYADFAFEDADEMMELYAAGELNPVYKAIDMEQYQALCVLVDDMIDYQRNQSGMDTLCSLLIREMKKPKHVAEEAHEPVEMNA